MKNKYQIVAGAVVSLLASLMLAQASNAISTDIAAPFDTGSTWFICQGYSGPITHGGTYALDITSSPNCDNTAPSGQNVRAPLSGTVAWYGTLYGSMCLNTLDGRSIALYHINSSLKPSDIVISGQVVGTVGASNTVGNGGIPHLHLEMWSTTGCAGANKIPFDFEHNARICGAPDLIPGGPDNYNNGAWSGTSFVATECTNDTTPVYRFWSPKNQHHFYTTSSYEALQIRTTYPGSIWTYEGISFSAPTDSSTAPTMPVYRFWSNKNQSHFYTISAEERDIIVSTYDINTWKYEGVAYNATSNQTDGAVPVYRFWSNKLSGHFYTISAEERDILIATYDTNTWKYEGVAFYVYQ